MGSAFEIKMVRDMVVDVKVENKNDFNFFFATDRRGCTPTTPIGASPYNPIKLSGEAGSFKN